MYSVLCVDDNIDLVEAIGEMLRTLGYESHMVTGGEECLDLLRSGGVRTDIILLDVMMFPVDGWTTLKCIRNDDDLYKIPVLMLTGKYPTITEIIEYSTLFDGYLMKPFALQSLASEIETVLDRARIREEVIQDARDRGADETVLNEYRRLSSTACVIDQFETIITNGTFTRDIFQEAEQRLESIMHHLNEIGVPTERSNY